jgi:hypothetical protein
MFTARTSQEISTISGVIGKRRWRSKQSYCAGPWRENAGSRMSLRGVQKAKKTCLSHHPPNGTHKTVSIVKVSKLSYRTCRHLGTFSGCLAI